MRSWLKRYGASYASVLVLALAVSGAAVSWMSEGFSAAPPPPAAPHGSAVTNDGLGFADLVERLSPAVVNIASKTKPHKVSAQDLQNPFEGTPFEDFFQQFNQQFGMNFNNMMTLPKQSLGSGVVISADGYVVTNNHVIEGADEITVTFNKGRDEYPAKVIGRDSKNDLALLKIKPKRPLPVAALGDSTRLRVGDVVLAIGNPFGLGGTVTSGIVSAMGRNIGQGPYDDFIQTDAAINPGNSGGPLFDAAGELVGINTAILTRNGGSNGIGFAVPVNTVKQVVAQIKQYGRPIHGWLGVKVQTLTKDLAASMNLPSDTGALVAEVTPDSPAARAGLKTGDVILTFNGTSIDEMSDLPRLVAETPLKKRVPVSLRRDGRTLTLDVTIAELPDDTQDSAAKNDDADNGNAGGSGVVGLDVEPLTAELRNGLNLSAKITGVLVAAVAGDSAAADSGLQRGDVIAEADWKAVKTPAELRQVLKARRGGKVLLRIYRDDGYLFIPLSVPK
jgi:serine protease Do